MSSTSQNTSSGSSSSSTSPVETMENQIMDAIARQAVGYASQLYDWAGNVFDKTSHVTDQAVGNFFDVSTRMNGLSRTMTDQYNNLFAPENAQLVADANSYASPARMAVDMGMAGATQAQAGEAALKNSEEALRSYGINPSDGRYAALDQASRVQNAANIAGAENQQRMEDIRTGQALRSQAVQVGAQLPSAIANVNNTAIQANTGASNAELANANTGANLFKLPNDYLSTGMNLKLPFSQQQSQSHQQSSGSSFSADPGGGTSGGNRGGGGGSPGGGSLGGGGGGLGGGGGGGGSWMPQHGDGQEDDSGGSYSQPGSGIMDTSGWGDYAGSDVPGGDWNYGQGGNGGFDPSTSDIGGGIDGGGGVYGPSGYDAGYNGGGWGGDPYTSDGGSYSFNDGGADYSGGGWGGDSYSGDYGGDYARGGSIPPRGYTATHTPHGLPRIPHQPTRNFADGGNVDPSLSPSGGAQTDDVPMQTPAGPGHLNANEYIIPQDVALWKGQEFFQKLIDQSRQARVMGSAKTQGPAKKPRV